MAEEIHEVVLLEDLPELGLHAGEHCGLPASKVRDLLNVSHPGDAAAKPKARVVRMGVPATAGH